MAILIGDIHGCFNTFQELIKKLPKNEKKILVGDFIDRGLDSKKMIEFLMNNKEEFTSVRGNHEQMMLDYYSGNRNWWFNNGASKTILSYGVKREDIYSFNFPKEHLMFIKSLPLYYEEDDFIVTHSLISSKGVFKATLERPFDEQGFLWYRGAPYEDFGKYNIFGHTPDENPEITDTYANIDTGCVYDHKLTAFHYPSKTLYVQKNIEPKPIVLHDITLPGNFSKDFKTSDFQPLIDYYPVYYNMAASPYSFQEYILWITKQLEVNKCKKGRKAPDWLNKFTEHFGFKDLR